MDEGGPERAPKSVSGEAGGPSTVDWALLAVALVAVSTSAPLIRYASAPTLAIAMWRNVLALPVLGWRGRAAFRLAGRERRLVGLAGLLLAAHFATWVPSVSFTSVSSSVALVATQPVWAALLARQLGHSVARGVWTGIGVALVGVVFLTGVDLSISLRALGGDALALVGGALAAAYVTVGVEVRRSVPTAVYSFGCYAVASAALLALCLVSRQQLWGYDRQTWLAIAGLTIGPQLLGHTLVNLVLRAIDATTVSVAILFEVLGASLLAYVWFGETPPLAAVPAAVLIGAGVVVVVRAGRSTPVAIAPID